MPLYSYRCRECDSIFDEFAPMAQSSDPKPCPECGEESDREITGSNFKFKKADGSSDRDCDSGRRKQKEDEWLGRVSSRARKLKASGEVPMSEPIQFNDRRIQDP